MNVDPLQKEPPTIGRIKLRTSMGDVEVGLWSKEAPLACRNVVQLALEGYYDNQIFHRIMPGFIVQTGDPTGTGRGGASIYASADNPTGEFKDEFHHRLKMVKRGLLAMANAGRPGSNESQFFVTLGPTPELQGKHTIWGKIDGPGIYTILEISEVELADKETGRPKHPPKLLGIDVIDNPFDDIAPRTTREQLQKQRESERRAKQELKEKKRKAAALADEPAGKKNKKLLSFGEEEEDDAGPSITKLNKSAMSAVAAAPEQSMPSAPPKEKARKPAEQSQASGSRAKPTPASSSRQLQDLSALRAENTASSSKSKQDQRIQELEAAIRGHARPRSQSPTAKGKQKENLGRAWLEEQRQQYAKGKARKDKKGDDREAVARLEQFKSKLAQKDTQRERSAEPRKSAREKLVADEEIFPEMREYGMSDDEGGDGDDADDWAAFRAHRFEAPKKGGDDPNDRFKVDDYEVVDPRSATAIKLGFGGEDAAKKLREEERAREGRRGRDWEDLGGRRYKEDDRGRANRDRDDRRAGQDRRR